MYFSCLSGPALLALLAAAPPWAVDSPAAAGNGARLGIGAGYLSENQESWEMDGLVAQLPLGLSCFRLTDDIRVFPTLTLEAGSMGISSSGRSGRGALFGARLGANASLCGSCPWFAGLSYRYRTLPDTEMDAPPLLEPGFEVLRHEGSWSQETHEISARLGYARGRIAGYVGARAQRTDVEVEDELRVVHVPTRREIDRSTRTDLESEAVQAVAGVDARLAGPLFGNLEVSAGGGGEQVLMKLVFIPVRHTRSAKAERYEEIARSLIPRLALLLERFRSEWRAASAEEADAVLLRNETALLELFAQYPELDPLADWVRDRFRQARESGRVASLSFQIPVPRRRAEAIEEVLESLEKIVRDGRFWTRFLFRASLGPGPRINVYPIYKKNDPASWATLPPGEETELVYGDYSFEVQSADAKLQCDALTRDRRSAPCPVELMNRPRFVLRCSPDGCTSKKWGERK